MYLWQKESTNQSAPTSSELCEIVLTIQIVKGVQYNTHYLASPWVSITFSVIDRANTELTKGGANECPGELKL